MHSRSSRMALAAGLLAVACAALSVAPALAVLTNKTLLSSATGLCQAALPNYEGNIRKRPLAVVNEGNSGAFVTCSFTALEEDDLNDFSIYFRNHGAGTVTVNCTAVYGSEYEEYFGATILYVPKSEQMSADGAGSLRWDLDDDVGLMHPTSLSCLLLPDVAISELEAQHWIQMDP